MARWYATTAASSCSVSPRAVPRLLCATARSGLSRIASRKAAIASSYFPHLPQLHSPRLHRSCRHWPDRRQSPGEAVAPPVRAGPSARPARRNNPAPWDGLARWSGLAGRSPRRRQDVRRGDEQGRWRSPEGWEMGEVTMCARCSTGGVDVSRRPCPVDAVGLPSHSEGVTSSIRGNRDWEQQSSKRRVISPRMSTVQRDGRPEEADLFVSSTPNAFELKTEAICKLNSPNRGHSARDHVVA